MAMKTICTCFLILLSFVLVACAEDDPFEPEESFAEGELSILAIGDSFIAWNREEGASIGDVIARELDTEVENLAVSGAYLTNQLSDAEEMDIRLQYIPEDWDWVVMDGGGNDLNDECGCDVCGTTLDEIISDSGTAGALPAFVEQIIDAGSQVVFISYYDVPEDAPDTFPQCRDIMQTYDERLALLAAQFPSFYVVDAEDVIQPSNLEFYDDDFLHPSLLGSEVIGELVADLIRSHE